MKTLSQADQDRIAQAVAQAEKTTAGEIHCVLAPEVGGDREDAMAWGAAAALLLPPIALFFGLNLESPLPGWPLTEWRAAHGAIVDLAVTTAVSNYIALQALVFIVTAMVVSIPPVRRLITPRPLKAARVKRAATTHFLAQGLHLTRERTGVLIFAALAEHRVEVIADEGIHAAAPKAVWDEVVADMVAGLKSGRIADGFVAAIARAGAILATHVPPRPDDVNELPDGLTVLPR
ncbi:TPM domain-containing protein [Caulobacter soli]|uniref:TPM domain-containing protein n=1 Tax=Caulobacter soli TaxID=2708539 RepID=UPI0013EBE4F2|nr:TPM domain-containing protein [Caulobacter soli]